MLISVWRIIRFSLQDVYRNVWLSMATITMIFLALFSVSMLLTVRFISYNAMEAVKEKVDISLYLRATASEEEILALKAKIEVWENVKKINYISKLDALSSFRQRNQNNPEILAALQELGRNPLSPTLVIYPENTDQAERLIDEIKRLDSTLVESKDFSDHSLVLQKINDITKKINEVGLAIILVFVITSILVAYNSIKVAIYTHKKEIEVMRLVGASNRFVYGPYFFSAILYAFVATMLLVVVFLPFLSLLQPYLEVFFTEYNSSLIDYFVNNFSLIFGLQFLAMAIICATASLLAVRRYAKV